MDVDRTNFLEGLAALKSALRVGDFYALDCEFTGLENGSSSSSSSSSRVRGRNVPAFRPPLCDAAPPPPTAVDDPEERWPSLRSQASRFAVAQVGIAVFEWVKSGKEGRGRGSYRAHPFNCWTFSTNPDSDASSFQCTPGSLAFLSGAGFDFNRWIGKGIPSCSARERDELLAREEARKGGGGAGGGAGGGGGGGGGGNGGVETKEQQQPPPQPQFQRPPIVPTNPHDVALVEETVSRVSAWLQTGEGGEGGDGGESSFLRLKAGNAFQRALVYQTLEKGPGLAALRFHPSASGEGRQEQRDARFVAKTLWPDEEEALLAEIAAASAAAEAGAGAEKQQEEPPVPSSPSLLPQQQQQRPRRADIVLCRVPPGGARLAAEKEAQQRLERARLSSGFALFLEALRDSNLPCAVHNGASDLAHVVASFGDGLPLPASFAGFRESVGRWFPGGVFDTKVLASGKFLRGAPFGSATALRDLYEGLVGGGRTAEVTNETTGTEAPPPTLSLLPRVPRPSLPASSPFSRYGAALRSGGSSISGLEHEAGFDALLTGASLWGLANALGAAGEGEEGGEGNDDDQSDDDVRVGNGTGGNNSTRRHFPTSLPPPPSLLQLQQQRPSPQLQQQNQRRDPSPRDLVASIEAASAAATNGGGDGKDAGDAPWILNPPRRVRASRLPRAALGCVYAHMSDWGVLPLMENRKEKSVEAASILPPERGNVLYIVPLPVLGSSEGGDEDVFRSLYSLATREAGAGRCRVTPRLRGWAASLELFEASAFSSAAERPPRPPPRPDGNGGNGEDPRPPRRSVDPLAVARALASLPQLRGCRVLDYSAFRDWKQRALSRFGESLHFVDEERAAAEVAAGERAALAAALEKDAKAAAAARGGTGVFGRRRAASTAASDGAGGDAGPPRKRSRGGEGGEGGGGGGGANKACVLM